jgi:acetyl esterase/lipase
MKKSALGDADITKTASQMDTAHSPGASNSSETFGTLSHVSSSGLPSSADGLEKGIYHLVDPELISVLQTRPQQECSTELLMEARKRPLMAPLPAPFPQPAIRHVPAAPGAPDVRVIIVDPHPGAVGRPVFVHTHGGGYVTENTMIYPLIQTIAHDCHCVVVSVDYRLAPETPYPGSLDDNYAALQWVYDNAEMLGIDRRRIAVGGESAGGGHAVALALRARDRKQIPVMFQLLIYPMLDDRTGSTHPVPDCVGRHIWTEASNRFAWTAFLGVPAGSPDLTPGSVPARVDDLSGLPPAWIGTGSIDLFADEDITFARRLIGAGVPTELAVFQGGYHGFDLLAPEAAVSKRFAEGWKSGLKRAFSNV